MKEAALAAPHVKQLSPLPLRSKKAKMLEYIARTCIELPVGHVDRAAYRQAIIEITTPLLKDVFFQSRLPYTNIQLDDFLQDTGEKVIGLIDRYYDPHRGTFASFVVMAGRQAAFKMLHAHDNVQRNSAAFSDGFGFEDFEWMTTNSEAIVSKHDPVYDGAHGVSQLLMLLREFGAHYGQRSGHDPRVARMLGLLSVGPKTVSVPRLTALAEAFGILPSEARKLLVTSLVLFKVYAIGKGIESIKELDKWVPSK
jgi:hypothetical protein